MVEQGATVVNIGVGDRGLHSAVQIDQPVPIGVVARETGHPETQVDAYTGKGHLGSHAGKAARITDTAIHEVALMQPAPAIPLDLRGRQLTPADLR